MCITAYSSTYLKMTSEETSAENSELVWTGYLSETFNETLGALHHARYLGSCLYIMKLVRLLFNVTPQDFSHQTCLPKYMTMIIGPGFLQPKSWLLMHHDWTSSYIVWEQMCTYQDIDSTIVQVVRQSLIQHL